MLKIFAPSTRIPPSQIEVPVKKGDAECQTRSMVQLRLKEVRRQQREQLDHQGLAQLNIINKKDNEAAIPSIGANSLFF